MEVVLLAAILVGLSDRSTSSDEAVRLTNVEIQLTKSGLNRAAARISNHNDFAVFNVVANCDFKDRRGHVLASHRLTITDAVQANGTRVIRNLEVDAWPEQARTAQCLSLEVTRLPD